MVIASKASNHLSKLLHNPASRSISLFFDHNPYSMEDTNSIPTVDLSVFLKEGEDEEGKKRAARDIISRACAEYGFFKAVNHGVPPALMSRAMELSKEFFALPEEVKLQYKPRADTPVPAGYGKQPPQAADKNEFLLMLSPISLFNVLPDNPPGFRGVLEELFGYFSKTCEVIESIVNDCLGLPPNFLKEYNHDRSLDLMSTKCYFPATETENVGISSHEDSNLISLLLQDQVGGLEVLKDGRWIPVVPSPEELVVNLGDIIQVVSNKKMKSASHRVTRQLGRSRHSFSYFYNLKGEKWVEPLPHFTTEIGEGPKYRGFKYKDYLDMRIRNKTHPPARLEDQINISYYQISP